MDSLKDSIEKSLIEKAELLIERTHKVLGLQLPTMRSNANLGDAYTYLVNIADQFHDIHLKGDISQMREYIELLDYHEILKQMNPDSITVHFNNTSLNDQKEWFQLVEKFPNTKELKILSNGEILNDLPEILCDKLTIKQDTFLENQRLMQIEGYESKYQYLKNLHLEGVSKHFQFPENTELKKITCVRSSLEEISPKIFTNTKLTTLDLSENDIHTLPKVLENSNITKLNLQGNNIKKAENLPTHSLSMLDFRNNEINTINREFAVYMTIEYLHQASNKTYLEGNQLSLKSCQDETWEIIVGVMGAQKTKEVFLDNQKPIFPDNPKEQLEKLKLFDDKQEKKQSLGI